MGAYFVVSFIGASIRIVLSWWYLEAKPGSFGLLAHAQKKKCCIRTHQPETISPGRASLASWITNSFSETAEGSESKSYGKHWIENARTMVTATHVRHAR
ncbi:uncharacterized protein BT62DRAFT_798670 [Guyanagaster necrorhizus]|uniref:Uncharacterized protein n=1 Tax=Guyanagaster necrorhizus TaxID=856835 RepID=A0A9P7VFM8_9AGAR|nr:uncharacterized protein BT62DRAFT_798670 [Guyanagaster necrorhizus MCA 3950]KAG7439124.1 hypothetical protein BT62DRAFT_798670 [Guyanagaster necrorhizus MCA 3950]